MELAHPLGVTVERVIGAIGRVDTTALESNIESTLTYSEDAKVYLAKTGVDMLAISCNFGTMKRNNIERRIK
jgi:fructose/tagatose bisphosphate aldolase